MLHVLSYKTEDKEIKQFTWLDLDGGFNFFHFHMFWNGLVQPPTSDCLRLQSAASVEAKDEEAACAEEAFDFPRFVVPLFGEEVWKPSVFIYMFVYIGMWGFSWM